jgi:hypothetical protein
MTSSFPFCHRAMYLYAAHVLATMPPRNDPVEAAVKDPVAEIRDAFLRIRFTEQAADILVNGEGLDSLENVRSLDSGAAVSNLCKNLRRGYGRGGEDGGAFVSQLAENNLSLLVFWLKHQARTSRQVNAGDVTLEAIHSLRYLRDDEARSCSSVPPVVAKPKIDPESWVQTFLDIQSYLGRHAGCTNVPLLYVVRTNPNVDPADTVKVYKSAKEEMIDRAPHDAEAFRIDNVKVYDLLMDVCGHDDACWSHMEPARPARDGRRAYQLLFNFYVDHDWGTRLATQAEAKLASFAYGNRIHEAPPFLGARVHFRSFDQYVVAHKKQHHVLDTLERWGYPTGVLLSQRKRYFLDGIFVDPYERIEVMASHRDVVNLDFDALVDKCRVAVVEDTEEKRHRDRNLRHQHKQNEKDLLLMNAAARGR